MSAAKPPAQPHPQSSYMRAWKNGEVILNIQVMPNAPKTFADGLYGEEGDQALKVRLHAPPVDGKANEALLRWLADELGIPRTSVELVRGKTSRRKQVIISSEAAAQADWKALSGQHP